MLSAKLAALPSPVEEGQVQHIFGRDGDISSRAEVNSELC